MQPNDRPSQPNDRSRQNSVHSITSFQQPGYYNQPHTTPTSKFKSQNPGEPVPDQVSTRTDFLSAAQMNALLSQAQKSATIYRDKRSQNNEWGLSIK